MTENNEKVESEMAEVETELSTSQDMGMESDSMDAMIEVSRKVGEFEKAMNTVMNFIIRQSYAGDWVSHSKADDPIAMRMANISGAGAERIARSLGIKEASWKRSERIWGDDKKSYTYECEADFALGKRIVHAIGRASSKDKFFGFAHGKWKELSDVKEDDIKMAAFRSCRKEGVRTLLGLRRIPLQKLKELGFNLEWVNYVNFKDAKAAEGGKVDIQGGQVVKSEFISEAQRKRLWAITQQAGWNEDQLREFLKVNYKILHTTDIPWKNYQKICDTIQAGGDNVGK